MLASLPVDSARFEVGPFDEKVLVFTVTAPPVHLKDSQVRLVGFLKQQSPCVGVLRQLAHFLTDSFLCGVLSCYNCDTWVPPYLCVNSYCSKVHYIESVEVHFLLLF